MAKYLRVTMSDGSVWDIPAREIALHRADWIAEDEAGGDSGEAFDRIFDEELKYALSDDNELLDWASNNEGWSDMAQLAQRIQVEPKKADYEREWTNAAKTIVEHD